MNLSRSRKRIKTRDGVPLKDGLIVYRVYRETGVLLQYTVKHWHDGKTSQLDPPEVRKRKKPHYVDVSGYGGAGFYPGVRRFNPFSFVPLSQVYAKEENARRYISRKCREKARHYKKLSEECLTNPVEVYNDGNS